MATYDLKYPGAAIDAILDTAYDLQNAGYIFRGLASEYSNTPTERSWVLAGEGETGHGFTSPVPKGYIGVCVFNGTSWTGKLLKCVSIDSTPTNGSTNALSSGGAYASISQLADTVNEALDNLTFTDTTPSAFLGEYITEKVSTTDGGIERILTYFTILAATTSKAGLLSAADKQKLDAILGNLRSLEIDDTTAYADLGDKIVESLKATIGGTEETISTFQILAATASKAGLLSAADKAKLDALDSVLGNIDARYTVSPYGFYDDVTGAVDINALYRNGLYITGTADTRLTLSSSARALIYNAMQTPKIRVISDYPSNDTLDGDVLLLRISSSLKPLEGKLLAVAIESLEIKNTNALYSAIAETMDTEIVTAMPVAERTSQNIDVNGDLVSATGNRTLSKFIVKPNTVYLIRGHVASRESRLYAFYGNGNKLLLGNVGNGSSFVYDRVVVSPEGADTLYIAGNSNIQNGICKTVGIKTIYPNFIYEAVSRNYGTFSYSNYDRGILSTPRFIKNCNPFAIKVDRTCRFAVIYYDDNYTYIGATNWLNILQDTPISVTPPESCAYMKISLRKDNDQSYPYIPLVNVELSGFFPDNWNTFNERPTDNGYHKIIVQVNITNPTCCDETSDNLQDSETISHDYGVICLPSQYKNRGDGTRMIIYCHGAAVNYDSDVIRFNSTDLEPEYWLAEGYAVMDVEGNPFNNTDEHFYIPQAMECYIAAYKWAIEHYNIKRDGVFLGGRSMGGGMAFNLLRRECGIPVIATCPNVPAMNTTLFWNYMSADRRQFCANHMGFVNQPTWTSTSPMPSAEWDCLKENFDKLVKYSPAWNIIADLPSKEVILANSLNISKNVSQSDTEESVYGSLHALAKTPVKLFGCLDDTTCPVDRTSRMYYKMLINTGNIAELRIFESGGHHYDTQNPNLRTTVTTRYGETMTNIPVVYIEMLQFWRRYENIIQCL